MTKIKENRVLSFTIITIVYILATFLGIFTYRALNFSFEINLLIADTVSTVVTFIFSLILKNSSVYDPYWSVQPPVIVAAFLIARGGTAAAYLIFAAILFWAIRLTANWAYTFKSLTHQDWRYTMLKERCGIFYPIINFIGIHYVPTIVVYFCTLPAVYVCVCGGDTNIFTIIFTLTAFMSAILQGVSDIYMHSFRKRGTVGFIRQGPWHHSRHPNYLGEILMWYSVALASCFSLGGRWYLLLGAVLNTILFLTVSIPMADRRQSRKPGFAEYKAATRMLLPIPKRSREENEQTASI